MYCQRLDYINCLLLELAASNEPKYFKGDLNEKIASKIEQIKKNVSKLEHKFEGKKRTISLNNTLTSKKLNSTTFKKKVYNKTEDLNSYNEGPLSYDEQLNQIFKEKIQNRKKNGGTSGPFLII